MFINTLFQGGDMERRKQKRYTKRCEVTFAINGTTYRGISSNLSLSGLFLKTRNPLVADIPLDLVVHFPDGSTSQLKGITKWASRNAVEKIKNGMGIEIIEYDPNYSGYVNSMESNDS
jgi:hypothetical protein